MQDLLPLRDAASLVWRAARTRLFGRLLIVAAIFAALHIWVATRPWERDGMAIQMLRIDYDRGLSEWFEYALQTTSLICATLIAYRYHKPAFWVVAALGAYMLFDNALGIHEWFGSAASGVDNGASHAAGELIPSIAAFVLFLVSGLAVYWFSDRTVRAQLIAIGLVVAVIAFFGIVVDGAHGMLVKPKTPLDGPLSLVEDGGEMVGIMLRATLMLGLLRAYASQSSQPGRRERGQVGRFAIN